MTRPARLPLETLQPCLLDVPHPGHLRPDLVPRSVPTIDWPSLFGRVGPVEIEVGFGKGLFLTDCATARPDVNFLGVEIERKYVLTTAARVVKRNLPNVKLACTDAKWFLAMYVAAGSVDALHVYFPDPWWKQKHKKRKLFTAEFTREARRILTPGGVFHFATDVKDYFDESLLLVRSLGDFDERPIDGVPEFMTNFERKYRIEGRPIYRTRFFPVL